MKKVRPMRQIWPETGEPLVIFFKTLIQLYLFCLFLYFWLTVSNRVSKEIFLDIEYKVLAYEAAMSWNRGIRCKVLQLLIELYLFCFLIYCSTYCIKKVIKGKIFSDEMNMLAYEAYIAWNRGIPCNFSKH